MTVRRYVAHFEILENDIRDQRDRQSGDIKRLRRKAWYSVAAGAGGRVRCL